MEEVVDRIEEPAGHDRPIGRLRLVAAVAVLIGGAWLVATRPTSPMTWVMIAISLAASLFWWRSFARIERGAAVGRALVLTKRGVRLEGHGAFELAWDDVAVVEIDQDRLELVFVGRDGARHAVEPPLGALGLDALAARVEAARARIPGASRSGAARP